jgi:NADH-quinone oxidoreductase subunit M
MSGTPLLSLAIWVPILAGLVVLATGSDRNAPLARMLSLIGALAGLLVTIPLYTGFDLHTPAMQFVELKSWIPRFNVNYHLGVDGISMLFVILNSFITVTVVLAGWQVIDSKVAQYNAGFLIMSGLLNGIFSALDGLLFYVFFEASLIPCT